jgi:hypothetical protein
MTITINGTTGIAGVDGSASTPAFKGNDTDTGVFYPSANEVAAAAGGSTVWNASSTFGFKNRIINGSMIVNQRGTQTGSPLSGYTLDRWLFSRTGTGSSTVSQAGSTGFGGLYALSVSSAHAAGEVFGVEQRIESANSYDLAGKTVTVQFWANASTSAGSLGAFSVALSYATATDNFASTTAISSTTFTPTSTPTLFTAQFSVPSAATTGLKLQFSGGQAGTTGTIQFGLGSVQLEVGTVATSFDFRSIGTELILCQRYYENGISKLYLNVSATLFALSTEYKVVKRAAATLVYSAPPAGGFAPPTSTEWTDTNGFAGNRNSTQELAYSWAASAEL